jgi:dTDP-4-dehydrorhamnose 3,5-epimerase
MINGVKITKLSQIFDERGKVMHMLRNDQDIFSKFGEIYFSYTHPDVVKAWHYHKEMTLNYAVIYGEIKLVLYDDRQESSTKGNLMELYSSPENYNLITVPPKIWNGFKTVGSKLAMLANCSDIPHDDNEVLRKDYQDPSIPYNWNLKIK